VDDEWLLLLPDGLLSLLELFKADEVSVFEETAGLFASASA
jgi:hypothetical protein